MKYYTDFEGKNPLSEVVIKEMILNADFLTAWYIVCVYIMQMDIQPFHMRMMKFQVENKNSLIMTGRNLGKSYTNTTAYIITQILRDRSVTICVISAGLSQSKAFTNELKGWFSEGTTLFNIFNDIRGEKWTETEILVKRDRHRKESTVVCGSANASSGLISKHFDILILDDIVSQENSATKGQRDKLSSFVYNTVLPLLNKESSHSAIKVIGTHYHSMDFFTELEAGSMFKVLKIPTIRNKNGIEYSIWEKKQPIKELIQYRQQMGSVAFNMQYQMKVNKNQGSIFKRDWIQYFSRYEVKGNKVYVYRWDEDKEREIEEEVRIYIGIDLAISQKASADDFVIAVVGVSKDKNVYLLDMYVGKPTFNEQVTIIKNYYNKWSMAQRVGVESVAYQQAMFQKLMAETSIPVVKVQTTKDKVSRMNVFSAKWEAGKVFLYYHLKVLDKLEEQTLAFPDAEHDDTIDAFEIAVSVALNNSVINTVDRNLFNF